LAATDPQNLGGLQKHLAEADGDGADGAVAGKVRDENRVRQVDLGWRAGCARVCDQRLECCAAGAACLREAEWNWFTTLVRSMQAHVGKLIDKLPSILKYASGKRT